MSEFHCFCCVFRLLRKDNTHRVKRAKNIYFKHVKYKSLQITEYHQPRSPNPTDFESSFPPNKIQRFLYRKSVFFRFLLEQSHRFFRLCEGCGRFSSRLLKIDRTFANHNIFLKKCEILDFCATWKILARPNLDQKMLSPPPPLRRLVLPTRLDNIFE